LGHEFLSQDRKLWIESSWTLGVKSNRHGWF
jgi:hypothetical protein